MVLSQNLNSLAKFAPKTKVGGRNTTSGSWWCGFDFQENENVSRSSSSNFFFYDYYYSY